MSVERGKWEKAVEEALHAGLQQIVPEPHLTPIRIGDIGPQYKVSDNFTRIEISASIETLRKAGLGEVIPELKEQPGTGPVMTGGRKNTMIMGDVHEIAERINKVLIDKGHSAIEIPSAPRATPTTGDTSASLKSR